MSTLEENLEQAEIRLYAAKIYLNDARFEEAAIHLMYARLYFRDVYHENPNHPRIKGLIENYTEVYMPLSKKNDFVKPFFGDD